VASPIESNRTTKVRFIENSLPLDFVAVNRFAALVVGIGRMHFQCNLRIHASRFCNVPGNFQDQLLSSFGSIGSRDLISQFVASRISN
jgi:hypothetical protein